jgi:DNA polymerase III delta prime subunit
VQVGVAPEQRALVAVNRLLHDKGPRAGSNFYAVASAWRDEQLTPLELADLISTGAGWSACHLGGRSHREEHVLASNLIVLDIDGDIRLEDFWAIPAVSRHCLFTATSCSHTEAEHRFRALFLSETISSTKLHGAIYDRWLQRLGIQLKDNCGRKPERLWYGNSAAVLQFGLGEPIPWDLIEDAKAELKAQAIAKPVAISSAGDQILDNRRAAWVFEHLLRPSGDGEYESYWQKLLNAAAATGDEAVQQAFLVWHSRGHHSKTQPRVARRLEKAGTKMSPGEGAGVIFRFAKQQHGELWWQKLPDGLRYGGGGGGAAVAPTSLLRRRPASSIQPNAPSGGPFSVSPPAATGATDPAGAVPDLVPSAADLQRLARDAQPAALFSSSRLGATDAAATDPAPISDSARIEQLLCQIYYLETERIDLTEQGEQQLTARAARYRIDQLESELLSYPVFRNDPSRIRTRLLQIFSDHNAIVERDSLDLVALPPLLDDDISNDWLIDKLMLRGASYLLYSPAGIGKTTFALLLARAVMGTPGHDNLLGHKVVPAVPFSQSRVLYVASDANLFARGDINNYLRAMQQQGQEWHRYMHVLAARRNDKAAPLRLNLQGFHLIVKHLDAYEAAGTPVTTLILDSLKACMPSGMLVGDQGVTALLQIMESICEKRNITLIYLHHQSKDSEQPQGVAGLTEMVHGYFRLKQADDGQRFFCVMKTRDGKGGKREIPYGLDSRQALVTLQIDEDDQRDPLEAALLELFSDHYSKHLVAADGDPGRRYLGIQRSDLLLLLRDRGLSDPSWRNAKVFDRPIGRLLQQGRLKKIEHGRYAIGHASQYRASEQSDLDLTVSYFDEDANGYGFV